MLHWALYPILYTGKTPRKVAWRFFADFRPQPQREKPEEKVNQLFASTIKREPPYDLAVVAPCQKRPTDTKRSIVTARPFVSALFVSQSPCPWNIPLSPVPIATNGWGNRYTHSNTWISFVDRNPRQGCSGQGVMLGRGKSEIVFLVTPGSARTNHPRAENAYGHSDVIAAHGWSPMERVQMGIRLSFSFCVLLIRFASFPALKAVASRSTGTTRRVG